MNHCFAKSAPLGTMAVLLVFTACGVAASHAPLGGNYAVADDPTARDRTATSASAHAEAAPAPEPEPAVSTSNAVAAAAAPSASAGVPLAVNSNLIHYDPLKVGDKIKVEVSVSFELALQTGHQGSIPGDGKLGIDAKYQLDLKVTQASAQTLDELEVTVTPLAMRTRYGDHSTEAPLDSPEKFRVSLGRSPSVKAPSGSASDDEGRAALLLLCATLADFHEHWSRSPSLELKSGWSVKSPISVPPIFNSHGQVLQAGPFEARYTGSDASAEAVSFGLTLPASFGGAIGKLDFDLTGSARLSRAQARPLAIELRGPANGSGGPRGELSARGFSKFSAAFSYP